MGMTGPGEGVTDYMYGEQEQPVSPRKSSSFASLINLIGRYKHSVSTGVLEDPFPPPLCQHPPTHSSYPPEASCPAPPTPQPPNTLPPFPIVATDPFFTNCLCLDRVQFHRPHRLRPDTISKNSSVLHSSGTMGAVS